MTHPSSKAKGGAAGAASIVSAHGEARLRCELDATLVHLIMGILTARSATVARLDTAGETASWRVSAQMRAGDPAVFSPASPKLAINSTEEIPGVGQVVWPALAKPAWNEALQSTEPVTTRAVEGSKGFSALTVFEVVSESAEPCIIEVEAAADMLPHDRRMISAMLRSYRQMDALIPSEQRDPVTGLLSAKAFDRHFIERLAQLSSSAMQVTQAILNSGHLDDEGLSFVLGGDLDRRSMRKPFVSWLGVVGLDQFSRVNSEHGHTVGDDVLLLLARIIRGTFRHHDRFFRLGGDEVAVILRCPTQEDAFSAFERFRVQLRRYNFPMIGSITASVGYTRIEDLDTSAAALSRSQMALQEAKDAGKDRIVHLDDTVLKHKPF